MLQRPDLNQTQLDLLAAAELIERCGLTKHVFHCEDGKLCMLGAISLATTGFPVPPVWNKARMNRAINLLGQFVPKAPHTTDSATNIMIWNDDEERTLEEVVDKFKEAAYNIK